MVFIDRFTRLCGGSRALAWLLIVNVATAVVCWLAWAVITLAGGSPRILSGLFALSSSPIVFITRPWTLVTYMAVHFSPLHLLFNMLWLYWFGRMMTDVSEGKTLIRVFVGAGVSGGIWYLLFGLLSGYPVGDYLTGASAAVLGVMTYTAFLMPGRPVNLFLIGEVKMKWLAAGCILLTVAGTYGHGWAPTAAHIGGATYGAVLFYMNKVSPFISKVNPRAPKIHAKATARAMERCVPEKERLDELLDKIRVSGYESLSQREKAELNHISKIL